MTTYDFSPLFRTTVGFDRLARMMDATMKAGRVGDGHPPYNIAAVGEDHYRITMAVAGFGESDLNIEVQGQSLVVSGKLTEAKEDAQFLYQGIATRSFSKKFQLADHVKVTDARLENGLLTIDLEREVPEAMKPRTIKIEHGAPESLAGKAKKFLDGGTKSKAKAA